MRRDAKRQEIAKQQQKTRKRLIIASFIIAATIINLVFFYQHNKKLQIFTEKNTVETNHANIKSVSLTKKAHKFDSQITYPEVDKQEINAFVQQQVIEHNNHFFKKINSLGEASLPYEQKINYRVGRNDNYLELAMTFYQDFREEQPTIEFAKWTFDKQTGEKIPEIPDKPAPLDSNKHPIALTFDDGPSQYTDQILMELRKYQTRATFFMLGRQAQKFPDLIKKVANEHHQIGNHTVNHPSLPPLSPENIHQEIVQNSQIINSVVPDYKIKVFRPPYGNYNQQVNNILGQLGMANILWSVDTLDWKTRDTQQICDHVKTNAKPGAVILMHDFYQTTAEAMPCILEFLQENNYQAVTISELFGELQAGEVYRFKE